MSDYNDMLDEPRDFNQADDDEPPTDLDASAAMHISDKQPVNPVLSPATPVGVMPVKGPSRVVPLKTYAPSRQQDIDTECLASERMLPGGNGIPDLLVVQTTKHHSFIMQSKPRRPASAARRFDVFYMADGQRVVWGDGLRSITPKYSPNASVRQANLSLARSALDNSAA